MSYVKIFDSIVASTIWGEPSDTRVVWVTMLALADRDGYVKGSVPGLAHLCRVSREACETALASLASPDPDSRTKTHEGRRIAVIPGGWVVLNYETYRDMATKEEKMEKDRLRQQRKRERDAASRLVTDVTVGHASSQEVASHLISSQRISEPEVPDTRTTPRPDGLGKSEKPAKGQRDAQIEAWFEEFWEAFNYRKDRKRALKEFRRIKDLDAVMPKILASAASYSAAHPGNVYQKHPSTWLNGECWNDDPEQHNHHANGKPHRRVFQETPVDFPAINDQYDDKP